MNALAKACFKSLVFLQTLPDRSYISAARIETSDSAAPSRGAVTICPVATRVFRYEGCTGCEPTYQHPLGLTAVVGKNPPVEQPMASRGGFYLPILFRCLVPDRPKADAGQIKLCPGLLRDHTFLLRKELSWALGLLLFRSQ